jgi:alkylhydroperoxidase/carboxymuconolactone decarboxylase family protein YurZ
MASKLKGSVKPVTQLNAAPQRKSNAQRQADYRARHLRGDDGQLRRLNVLINFHAKYALERLAFCYGVTQQTILERLIVQAERVAVEQAYKLSRCGDSEYYDKKLRLPWPDVTE